MRQPSVSYVGFQKSILNTDEVVCTVNVKPFWLWMLEDFEQRFLKFISLRVLI